jgi:hypothetical protein
MGLVNEVNTIVENERIEKVKSVFAGYDENEKVYCITSLDCNRLYSVCSGYKVATTVQKTYRIHTSLWFTTVNKAKEHFVRCLLVKNTEKLHRKNEKLMKIEDIERIAKVENSQYALYSITKKAIGIQLGKIKFERMISNGEKSCKFYPFNDTTTQGIKEYYFSRYLQYYGTN